MILKDYIPKIKKVKGQRLYWKLQYISEKNEIYTNGNILHAYGLGESILLKYQYYSTQYTGSMQSLSNSKGIFNKIKQIVLKFIELKILNNQGNL